jgi:hypothetical protein
VRALQEGDAGGAAEHVREDAVWLGPEGRVDGAKAVLGRLTEAAAVDGWDPEPQQHGAHGVLRCPGGALVVETRRGLIVLVATA